MTLRGTARLAAAGLALVLAGCGFTAPRSSEGFADLDSLGILDVDNTLTLSIGPTLLRLAAKHTGEDPETQAILAGLDGVRVRVYEIDGDPIAVAGRVDRMGLRLQDQGWEPVALVREAGETTVMLIKAHGARIAGLTVLSADEHEAVVVNVMGDLRPEMFADTMVALDMDMTPAVQIAANP